MSRGVESAGKPAPWSYGEVERGEERCEREKKRKKIGRVGGGEGEKERVLEERRESGGGREREGEKGKRERKGEERNHEEQSIKCGTTTYIK
jgi:hypothetical protein